MPGRAGGARGDDLATGGSARRGLRRDAAATFWCDAEVMRRLAHKVAEPSRLWLRTGWIGPPLSQPLVATRGAELGRHRRGFLKLTLTGY